MKEKEVSLDQATLKALLVLHIDPKDFKGWNAAEREKQLKKARNVLLLKYHPDKNPPEKKQEMEEKAKEINAAFEKLTGSAKEWRPEDKPAPAETPKAPAPESAPRATPAPKPKPSPVLQAFRLFEIDPASLEGKNPREKYDIFKARYEELLHRPPQNQERSDELKAAYQQLVKSLVPLEERQKVRAHATACNENLRREYTQETDKIARQHFLNDLEKSGIKYEDYLKSQKSYQQLYDKEYKEQYNTILPEYESFYKAQKENSDQKVKKAESRLEAADQKLKKSASSLWGILLAPITLGLSLLFVAAEKTAAKKEKAAAERALKFAEFASRQESPTKVAHQMADAMAAQYAEDNQPFSKKEWENKLYSQYKNSARNGTGAFSSSLTNDKAMYVNPDEEIKHTKGNYEKAMQHNNKVRKDFPHKYFSENQTAQDATAKMNSHLHDHKKHVKHPHPEKSKKPQESKESQKPFKEQEEEQKYIAYSRTA